METSIFRATAITAFCLPRLPAPLSKEHPQPRIVPSRLNQNPSKLLLCISTPTLTIDFTSMLEMCVFINRLYRRASRCIALKQMACNVMALPYFHCHGLHTVAHLFRVGASWMEPAARREINRIWQGSRNFLIHYFITFSRTI